MKKILEICLFVYSLLFCAACVPEAPMLHQYADTAMGTVMQFALYTEKEQTADTFTQNAMELLRTLEQEQLSRRIETSEIYKVNASAGNPEGIEISTELAETLNRCMDMWKQSDGAFDIALGAVVQLWQIDSMASGETPAGDVEIPSPEEIEDALKNCGSDKIKLQNATTITIPAGVRLDLGAVGKGVALDKIHALLESCDDISGGVISAGGSVLVYGSKPDNSNWKVGIVNPFNTAETIGTLTLDASDWYITTSGDYERYVEADGVRYHHIIDPATGYPAQNGVRGVTILTKDGLLGDMLSTACFVLGAEEGLELAEKYNAEILFVLSDGEILMSKGMKQYFRSK